MRSELPPSAGEIAIFGINLMSKADDPELIPLIGQLGDISDALRRKINRLERLEIKSGPFIQETDRILRWVEFKMAELGSRKLVLSSCEDLKWIFWKIGTLISKVEIHENGREYAGTTVWQDKSENEFQAYFRVDNPRSTITDNNIQCVHRPFGGEAGRSGPIDCSYEKVLAASSGRLLIKGCFLDHFREHVEGLKKAAK